MAGLHHVVILACGHNDRRRFLTGFEALGHWGFHWDGGSLGDREFVLLNTKLWSHFVGDSHGGGEKRLVDLVCFVKSLVLEHDLKNWKIELR